MKRGHFLDHSKPSLSASDFKAVEQVMTSGMIAQGRYSGLIEDWFVENVEGANHAFTVGSGAQALEVILRSLDVVKQRKIMLPAYICSSVCSAALNAGFDYCLADSGPNYCSTHSVIEQEHEGFTAQLAVHMFGIRAELPKQVEDIELIEDFAHALSHDIKLSANFGFFSFSATKMIAGGEGGCIVCRTEKDAAKIRKILSLPDGHTRSTLYPFSDLQAALVLNQLQRLGEFSRKRIELAEHYLDALSSISDVSTPVPLSDYFVPFRIPVQLNTEWGSVDNLIERMADNGIGVRRPVDPFLGQVVGVAGSFKVADSLWKSTFSMPLYPDLSIEEIFHVSKSLKRVLNFKENGNTG